LALAGTITVVRFVARYRDLLVRMWAWAFRLAADFLSSASIAAVTR